MGAVCDTLILSDLHLSSEISRARDALRMLKQSSFRRLILLGDIFSDLNFGRLKKEHWQFLGYIRKLSNPKRQVEVVWVEGNHDRGLTEVMSHLVGVNVYQEYSWEYSGMRHLAIHGHQFDRFVINNLLLSRLGTLVHIRLQKVQGKPFARLLDRLNTRWLRLSSKVSSGAVSHARFRQAGRVFCGHTHAPMHIEKDGIQYFNAGSWTDSRPTFVTIGEEGVHIHEYHEHEYDERPDDCDPSEERSESDSAVVSVAGEAGLLEDAEYEGVGS